MLEFATFSFGIISLCERSYRLTGVVPRSHALDLAVGYHLVQQRIDQGTTVSEAGGLAGNLAPCLQRAVAR